MKTKKLILSSFVVASIILTIGCAGKFHKDNFEDFIFERFDKNHDGQLNKKEHFNIQFSRFEKIDDNENGNITKKELKEYIFSNIKLDFSNYYLKKYDSNNDGKVMKLELIEKSKEEFYKLDSNNNGLISKTEYKKQKLPLKK
ncbi:EF-hand domain-containing protein [Malaciobacter marinus]|uniref:EF-hand domain-containing protein n=1 Tax=Malaciobacter marinus TaxID=505249 RepID=UPI003AFFB1ED